MFLGDYRLELSRCWYTNIDKIGLSASVQCARMKALVFQPQRTSMRLVYGV
jgi:hypothetical protein